MGFLSSKIFLFFLFAASATASLVFWNQWKHATRELHVIAADSDVLQRKINADPPEWMLRQINEDLRPYADGISSASLSEAFKGDKVKRFNLVRFTISNGQIAVSLDDRNLNRRHFLEFLGCLQKLNQLTKLPDVDFIVSLEDGFDHNPDLGPCFVFAKRSDTGSLILIPDIKALAGYGKIRQMIPEGNKKHPWEMKVAKGFWRGSSTGGQLTALNWDRIARAKLCLLSLKHPKELDARFHNVVQCDPELPAMLQAKGLVSGSVDRVDHLKYKYLVDVDGNSCSYERYFWLLLSNSLVLKQVTPNVQWYYGGLTPYVHYLPVQEDLSDLVEKIEWARAHDAEAQAMSERAMQFVRDNLSSEDILLYIYLLFKQYALLQH
jgi:hypothetical protein